MKKLMLAIILILILAVSVSAAPPAQVSDGQEYVVQANDWLSKLALKYYGDMFAYGKIVAATNAKAAEDPSFAVIDNPDMIEVGQKLWIPAAVSGCAGVGLTIDMLKNAQYGGIYNTAVQLTDGHYEGKPFVEGGATRPTVDFVDDFYAFGELNGDGVYDAVVFLAENSGGSGVFTYVAAVLNQNSVPVNVGTINLGDRITLISVAIEDGVISVDMVTQGPDDPLCCATLEVVKSFKLQNRELVELPQKEVGVISETMNAARLAGTTWVLRGFDSLRTPVPVLDGSQITLNVDADAGQISGSAGCNNYMATFTEDENGFVLGPVAATQKMCSSKIMTQEQKFLSKLQTVNSYRIWNGKLLFSTEDGFLIFVAQK